MKRAHLCLCLAAAVLLGGCAAVTSPSAFPTAAPASQTPGKAHSLGALAEMPMPAPPTTIPTPTPAPLPKLPAPRQSELDYFLQVAFNAEYNAGNSQGYLKRWEQPVYLEVSGKATKTDMKCIRDIVKKLSEVEGMPPITLLNKDHKDKSGAVRTPNMRLLFIPLSEFADKVPGYVEGNWSYTSVTWNDYLLQFSVSAIAIDKMNQRQRNHNIIERVVDSLGFLQDVNLYPDSIFFGDWTETQKLSSLDWTMVRMLYSPAVKAGMTRQQAAESLTKWLESQD